MIIDGDAIFMHTDPTFHPPLPERKLNPDEFRIFFMALVSAMDHETLRDYAKLARIEYDGRLVEVE